MEICLTHNKQYCYIEYDKYFLTCGTCEFEEQYIEGENMKIINRERGTGKTAMLVCHKKVYKTDYANQKIKSKYCPNCGVVMNLEGE